jgi:hypothetical protein
MSGETKEKVFTSAYHATMDPKTQRVPWGIGAGLCTSYCIAVNEETRLYTQYVDHKRHRVAFEVVNTNRALVIDSAKKKIKN